VLGSSIVGSIAVLLTDQQVLWNLIRLFLAG